MRIKLASQRAVLLAGILALPSAMNGAIFYHYDLDPRNGSHSDAIDPAGEEDVYRITVTGSGTLTVYSTGSTDVYGYLLSSSGSELASDDDSGQGYNFQISHSVSAGTYYVRVRHYSTTGTGDYSISSSFDGGSHYYGSILNLDDSLKSSIDSAGEEDLYRTTVTESGSLTIYSTDVTDTYGTLLDSAWNELASNDDGGPVTNFRISHSVSAGTYYVRVRHYSTTGTGDYQITSNFYASSSDGGGSPGKDSGGSGSGSSIILWAYTLSLNGSSSDAIDTAGDEDWYRVTVVESGTLTVYSTGDTDVYGYLLSSSGSELASDDDSGENRNFRISHSVNAGTYYVRVRHYSTTDVGDYGITSSFTASSSSSGSSSSDGVVGFSVSDWERAVVSAGTTHNSIITTPVDTTTHPTHNLSGMTGAFNATYEFVVNVPQTDQFSPCLLGDNVWWLKFDQERAASTQVNQLGVTRRNVEDYFFISISGRSLASPYNRDAHIIYTYDGADTEVFVDGQQVGIMYGWGHIFTDAASELGWSSFLPDSLLNLKGRILAFASYREVLPDEKIQSHYNAAFPSGIQSPPAVPQPQPTLNPDGDEDNDGLTNAEETQLFAAYNLDPYNADSDGDGTNDGYEDFDSDQVTNIFELRTFHSDPLDAYSLDPNNQVTDSAWLFLAPLDSSSALQLARTWGQIQAGQSSAPPTTLLIDHHETETSNGRASIRFTGTTVADGVTHLNFVFTPRNNTEETFDLYFRPGVSGTTYWAWIEVLPAGQTIAIPVSLFASPQGFFTGGSRADTDQDGLTDGFELLVSKTNPTNPDSAVDRNGDGQIDAAFSGLANNHVYDSQEDFEPDNLRNEAEYYLGTNPFRSDSDDDGTNDDEEEPPTPPGALPGDGEEEYDEQPFAGLSNGLHEYSGTVNLTGISATPDDMAGIILEKTPEGNVILSSAKSTSSNQVEIAAKVIVRRPRERLPFTGAPYHPPTGQNGGKLPISELRGRYPYIANNSGSGRSVGNGFGTGLTQMNQSVIDTWDE